MKVDFENVSPEDMPSYTEMYTPNIQRSFEKKVKEWCTKVRFDMDTKLQSEHILKMKKKIKRQFNSIANAD